MKIELTDDEFRDLIMMIYLAEWVLHAHDVEVNPDTVQYTHLEQKLFKLALKHGMDDWIEYEERHDVHYPMKPLAEGEARQHINTYDNNTFWDELASRLATRDLIRRYGSSEAAWEMPVDRRFKELFEIEGQYSEEFATHGLERIRIGRPGRKKSRIF